MNNMRKNLLFESIRTLIVILISLAISMVIIVLVSKDPLYSLQCFLLGPVSTLRHFGNVIELTIPLIFTGIAVCIMFQAKQFTMIAEGSFFFGGFAAAFVAVQFVLPAGIHPLVAILVGGIFGAVISFIPAILKAKLNTNEFVTSLMLNYVVLYLGLYLLKVFINDPTQGGTVSYLLKETAKLPDIVSKTRIHAGIFIALGTILLSYFYLYKTRWGFSIRMTGFNKKFAEYSGISTFGAIISSQLIGGFIAGIGGATEILGMFDRFQWKSLPGYGFDGIVIAILARQNPAFVPLGAIFLAYLRIGADIMSRMSDVTNEVVFIIQSIIIILIAATGFLSSMRHRFLLKSVTSNEI